jgi:hypothetical protein
MGTSRLTFPTGRKTCAQVCHKSYVTQRPSGSGTTGSVAPEPAAPSGAEGFQGRPLPALAGSVWCIRPRSFAAASCCCRALLWDAYHSACRLSSWWSGAVICDALAVAVALRPEIVRSIRHSAACPRAKPVRGGNLRRGQYGQHRVHCLRSAISGGTVLQHTRPSTALLVVVPRARAPQSGLRRCSGRARRAVVRRVALPEPELEPGPCGAVRCGVLHLLQIAFRHGACRGTHGCRHVFATVELKGEFTRGQTVRPSPHAPSQRSLGPGSRVQLLSLTVAK